MTEAKLLSSVQARNSKLSLYPTQWAKKYRSVETDIRAYEDRERLLQVIDEAPFPAETDSEAYKVWHTKAIELLRSTGNYPYRYINDGAFT